uniref:Cyclin-H1-1 isoform X2 n=1 Tax=Rhizophora mucronata TaxID=61149 RepID=A0A2P2KYX2_RHIMU
MKRYQKDQVKSNKWSFYIMQAYRKYSSCEPCPQQDLSFRLMCFISLSVGKLYFFTQESMAFKDSVNSEIVCTEV